MEKGIKKKDEIIMEMKKKLMMEEAMQPQRELISGLMKQQEDAKSEQLEAAGVGGMGDIGGKENQGGDRGMNEQGGNLVYVLLEMWCSAERQRT